jgi:hypothetical protein
MQGGPSHSAFIVNALHPGHRAGPQPRGSWRTFLHRSGCRKKELRLVHQCQLSSAAGRVLPQAAADGAVACDADATRNAVAPAAERALIPARATARAGTARHSSDTAAGGALGQKTRGEPCADKQQEDAEGHLQAALRQAMRQTRANGRHPHARRNEQKEAQ